MSLIKFELKESHIKLSKNLNLSLLCSYLNGDKKVSPFGGENVYEDMDLIINGKPENINILDFEGKAFTDEEMSLYDNLIEELPTAVSIILSQINTTPGKYKRRWHDSVWVKY